MNSKRINTIFNSQKNLSRKDIDTYRETSDEKLKQVIEEKALDSDFDNDALEGWSIMATGTTGMKKMDQKWNSNSSSIKWGIAGSIIVILIIFLVIYLSPIKTINAPEEQTTSETTSVSYEKTDLIIPEEIEEMKELPKKQQIQIATIRKDFSIQQKEDATVPSAKEQEKVTVENLPVKPIEQTKIKEELARKQTLASEIYLEDLKLVDYRNYRSKPTVSTKKIHLSGTPASKEDESSKEEEAPEWETVEIPYMEYIDKSMAIFAKGNMKKALSRFEIILETYPTDINANFYGGLCYFNLGEYTKAIATFEKCLDSEFINFNEEAEWYLAKSYLADGNKDKANNLFKKIRDNGGYYSKQAKNNVE